MKRTSVSYEKAGYSIPKIAKEAGLENGYRIISNCGPDADQTVLHLHFHILGGQKLPSKLV